MLRNEERTNIQNSIGRLVITGLSFFIQLAWLTFLGYELNEHAAAASIITSIVSLVLAIWVFERTDTNANFKMPWIMLILAFPIVGLCLFIIFGHKYSRKVSVRMDEIHRKCASELDFMTIDEDELNEVDRGIANQFRYLIRNEGFPLFHNTEVTFFDEAYKGYDDILSEVSQAKKYIFMEYFAIQDKEAFSRLHGILKSKVREGVDVRILYDDVGSIGFINNAFAKKLSEEGIKCKAFNKVSPAFRWYMNNRDHRKITVIDGKVAYTGGYNIADEYFNITHPYGWWKDTGLKLKGPAVNSFLCMFMEMWCSSEKEIENFKDYINIEFDEITNDGYVLPYADSPLDDSRVGENVYMNLLSNAKKSFYITTPYLVASDEMVRALQLAACRGVDVRILTPGIPDKKITYRLTRSYYRSLIKSGVKIYEYTPGFPHCKQVVVDDEIAVVGTINMDYRSLFHHFENGVMIYKVDAVKDISDDFNNIFEVSECVNCKYMDKPSIGTRIVNCLLRLIAPLL